ncbi:MAG TPA: L,D-transpeptidase/peptidoglycan binding protein [Solirubrobacterales bacterium]|jgi:lipoprotein-anchoring transpeptidase ErfK/SrfK|nr:L,D-transpeptidase/peptidoglycan binding protein [Solirubrobacterales bacterium]
MGRKAQISLVAVVLTAIVVALLAYVWDSTRDDRIAEGVTIGGVDVGGLDATNAKRQVQTSLLDPLNETVTVKYDGEKFTLTPHESDLSADIDRTIDEAVAVSREGGLPTRTWRALTGGEVDEEITPKISYDQDAVDHFVAHIAGNIDRDAVDASVEPSGGKLVPVSSKSGRKIDEDALRNDVVKALEDPAQRTVKADVEKVKPEVTTSEVADRYPTYLVVDRSNFTLTLYDHLKLEKQYTVAIGAVGFDTPTGLYHIQNKQVDPVWNVPDSAWAGDLAGQTIPPGPDNPLKARWMGIFDGAGIHGTSDTASLGSAASHGCVRMSVPDVIDLYDRVDVGTPIYIG